MLCLSIQFPICTFTHGSNIFTCLCLKLYYFAACGFHQSRFHLEINTYFTTRPLKNECHTHTSIHWHPCPTFLPWQEPVLGPLERYLLRGHRVPETIHQHVSRQHCQWSHASVRHGFWPWRKTSNSFSERQTLWHDVVFLIGGQFCGGWFQRDQSAISRERTLCESFDFRIWFDVDSMLVDSKDFSSEKKTIGSAKGGKMLPFVKPESSKSLVSLSLRWWTLLNQPIFHIEKPSTTSSCPWAPESSNKTAVLASSQLLLHVASPHESRRWDLGKYHHRVSWRRWHTFGWSWIDGEGNPALIHQLIGR